MCPRTRSGPLVRGHGMPQGEHSASGVAPPVASSPEWTGAEQGFCRVCGDADIQAESRSAQQRAPGPVNLNGNRAPNRAIDAPGSGRVRPSRIEPSVTVGFRNVNTGVSTFMLNQRIDQMTGLFPSVTLALGCPTGCVTVRANSHSSPDNLSMAPPLRVRRPALDPNLMSARRLWRRSRSRSAGIRCPDRRAARRPFHRARMKTKRDGA